MFEKRVARRTGVDTADTFIRHARNSETQSRLGIDYQVAIAVNLPFSTESFAFDTGFMSFMDIPETEKLLLVSICRLIAHTPDCVERKSAAPTSVSSSDIAGDDYGFTRQKRAAPPNANIISDAGSGTTAKAS